MKRTSPSAEEGGEPAPARLAPSRPFPSYTYIPGALPHPIGDPAGHSFGRPAPQPAIPDPANWQQSEEFRYAIDLFNAGYYWEAHEAWESLWIAAGRRGATADFLKALIKLAAAGVKLREHNLEGARRHLRRSRQLVGDVAAARGPRAGLLLGLECVRLEDAVTALLDAPLAADLPPDGRPQPVLPIELRPK